MVLLVLLALALQSIVQRRQTLSGELDEEMRQHMQQRAEFLSQQTTRLLQEVEESDSARGALLFAALQQWQVWAVAALLVLLFRLCWWLRKRSGRPANSSKEGTTRDETQTGQQEEKLRVARHVHTVSADRLLDLSASFTMVEELMDELLHICGKLSRNSFMPRLKPVVGVSGALGCWSAVEEDVVYHLLVPLKPPRGHTFHVDHLGTATKDMPPARSSSLRLRVDLQCTCMKEPLEEDMLCFLHHTQEELREKQGPSLLRTLCTGPYLDTHKTACWLQLVVKGAWAMLPQSKFCCLTVLPSRHSCKLRLTHASNSTILIDMTFGVKQGDSYIFLSTA